MGSLNLGPPSRPIHLEAFRKAVDAHSRSLVDEDSGPLARLNDDQRQWLRNRLEYVALPDTPHLRTIGDRVYRRPQRVIELDEWQKARYSADREDDSGLAAAQERSSGAVKVGGTRSAPLVALKKKRKRKATGVVEADKEVGMFMPGADDTTNLSDELLEQLWQSSHRSASHTSLPTAPNGSEPPPESLPEGLNMYKPFTEAQYYMKQTKKSDYNTLLGVRYHARGYLAEFGASSLEAIIDGQLTDADRGPPASSHTKLILLFTFHALGTSQNSARQVKLAILSTQTLADLADGLLCPSDAVPEPLPSQLQSASRTKRYRKTATKSGCVVLIENIIYSDTRPGRANLARCLQDQLQLAAGGEPREQTTSSLKTPSPPPYTYSSIGMQDMHLGNLTLSINRPYWLVHQGNCEHIFTLDAVRTVHAQDKVPLDGPACPYPLIMMASRLGGDKCRVCNRDPATRILIDDELAGDSPALVCDTCFHYLHGPGGELASVPSERQTQQEEAESAAQRLGIEIIPILDTLALR